MNGSWPVWIALVALVLSHVGMFALGVAAYHCLRWINLRPVLPKPPLSESKLLQMADKLAQEQVKREQFSWLQRNQQVQRPVVVDEQIEEAFAPGKK